MPDLLTLANESLDRVLRAYQHYDIELEKRPTIGILPDSPLLACIKRTINVNPLDNMYFKELLQTACNYSLSNEAINDFINTIFAGRNLPKQIQQINNMKEDIIISNTWEQIMKKSNDKYLDSVIMHETCHIIEQERCILAITSSITEGTARYAQSLVDPNYEKIREYSFFKLKYEDATQVVRKYVNDTANSLQSMFDLQIRYAIQEEFLEMAQKQMPDIAKKTLEYYQHKKEFRIEKKLPAQIFMTPNETLDHFRKLGATTFVDQIKDQNSNCLEFISTLSPQYQPPYETKN